MCSLHKAPTIQMINYNKRNVKGVPKELRSPLAPAFVSSAKPSSSIKMRKITKRVLASVRENQEKGKLVKDVWNHVKGKKLFGAIYCKKNCTREQNNVHIPNSTKKTKIVTRSNEIMRPSYVEPRKKWSRQVKDKKNGGKKPGVGMKNSIKFKGGNQVFHKKKNKLGKKRQSSRPLPHAMDFDEEERVLNVVTLNVEFKRMTTLHNIIWQESLCGCHTPADLLRIEHWQNEADDIALRLKNLAIVQARPMARDTTRRKRKKQGKLVQEFQEFQEEVDDSNEYCRSCDVGSHCEDCHEILPDERYRWDSSCMCGKCLRCDDCGLIVEKDGRTCDLCLGETTYGLPYVKPHTSAIEIKNKVMDSFDTVKKHMPDDKDSHEQIMRFVETLAILIYQLARSENYTDVTVAIASFIQKHTTKSLVGNLVDYIQDIAGVSEEEVMPQAFWSESWKTLKSNPIWTHVHRLTCAGMAIWCDAETDSVASIGNLKLVTLEASKKTSNAFDLIDSVITSLDWMFTVGTRCLRERSLQPILYSSSEVQHLFQECDKLLLLTNEVKIGSPDIDVGDIQQRAVTVLEKLEELKLSKNHGGLNEVLMRKQESIKSLLSAVKSRITGSQLRKAPLGFKICGPTGVGKSTTCNILMQTCLVAQGFEYDTSRITTISLRDKFQSTYNQSVQGVILDDVANAKPGVGGDVTPHTDVIISMFNNIPAQALNAQVDLKGQIFFDFAVGGLTTNVEDLDVDKYSNCGEATLRRMIHINQIVKPEYCKPGTTMLNSKHEELDKETPDCWWFDIKECVVRQTVDGKYRWYFQIYTHTNEDGTQLHCDQLSLRDLILVMRDKSREHAKIQERLINNLNFNRQICSMCCLSDCECTVDTVSCDKSDSDSESNCAESEICIPHSMESMILGKVFSDVKDKYWKKLSVGQVFSEAQRDFKKSLLHDLNACTRSFSGTVAQLCDENLPTWVWQSRTYVCLRQMLDRLVESDKFGPVFQCVNIVDKLCLAASAGLFYKGRKPESCVVALGAISAFLAKGYMYRCKKRKVVREIAEHASAGELTVKIYEDVKRSKQTLVFCGIGLAIGGLVIWNKMRIRAHSEPEVNETQSWFSLFRSKRTNVVPKTSTVTQNVLDTVAKNQVVVKFRYNRTNGTESEYRSNGVFVRKGVLLIPKHTLHELTQSGVSCGLKKNLKITVIRNSTTGGTLKEFPVDDTVVVDSHGDYILVHIPHCPDVSDISKWFGEGSYSGTDRGIFVGKDLDSNEFCKDEVYLEHKKKVSNSFANFVGMRYSSCFAKNGMCTSLLIRNNGDPKIIGIHIGGVEGGNAVGISLDKTSLSELVDELENKTLRLAEPSPLPHSMMGRPILSSVEVHKRSHMLKISELHAELMGSSILRTKARSKVKRTSIADDVCEVLGYTDDYGPPPMEPNWKNFNIALDAAAVPSDYWIPAQLLKARKEFVNGLMKHRDDFLAYCERTKTYGLRPLLDDENMSGVAGSRFIDAIIMNTSMGYPIFGVKSKYFKRVDTNNGVTYIMDDLLKKEIEKMYDLLASGKRCNPIVEACLKDEVVTKDKDKTRVFYIAQVSFGFLIRRYFLPIVRFMGLYPHDSMCAVGINAMGPEWNKLEKHLCEYGNDFVALDYSKFDVRMNSQVTQAALMSMIDLVRGVYPESDIRIMETMVTDMSHPIVSHNGTLAMFFSTNPSGNNVTVQVNSVVNFFYLHMAFQDLDGREFHDHVRLITYGDDAMASVRNSAHFNFHELKKWFAERSIKITLPDKSDGVVKYYKFSEVDFLKRSTSYIEELDTTVGALDENSIAKSLMYNIPSTVESPREQLSSTFANACHEWFAYGRVKYDSRMLQMKEVCQRQGWKEPIFDIPYDARVEEWKEKYV
uniref:Putative non-structural protein n=1 Tax=Picornavirales N_OV_011 TaxID=2016021 RepID=A0A218NJR6_9VIRU|nr:putative non-structural protein [Picornavirales N_OV_011]